MALSGKLYTFMFLVCLLFVAFVEDAPAETFNYPETLFDQQSSITLEKDEKSHFLTFKNKLNSKALGSVRPTGHTFNSPIGKIIVHIHEEDGDIPDWFEVVPPQGYIAIPNIIHVDEESSGVIRIYQNLIG